MATEPLIKVSCVSKGEKIGLTNYSDLVVFDKEKTIVALRIGGYPETVQAMSDIIITGCDLELEGASETIEVNTKGQKNYERRLSHDGIYAEGMHYLKDDVKLILRPARSMLQYPIMSLAGLRSCRLKTASQKTFQ